MATSFEEPCIQSTLEKITEEEGFEKPKFSINSGSKPGDNFACRILRTEITETSETKAEKSLSLIFKLSPLNKERQAKVSIQDLYRTEADVYETVLPTLNQLLNKHGVVKSGIFPNTVRCFASNLEDKWCNILVLEDKSTDGYRMIGDHKSFDADHCRHVLKTLALWHSASLALKYHDSDTWEQFKKALTKPIPFTNVNGPLLNELKHCFSDALAMIKDRIKESDVEDEKLDAILQNFPNLMVEANKIPSDLCCIIQGDCWFNNILYKYNKDGTLQDVCLIDHQLTRLASPALELSYVMFLCSTKEVRDASYDELIRFYHSEVSSNLKMMECDPNEIIPWELLQEHLKKYGKCGALVAIAGLPVVLADSSDSSVDLHSADDDGTIFAGRAKTSDPKKREEISQRIADVVIDAFRWGFF